MSHMEGLFDLFSTNFTKTVHKDVYPTVDPSRLDQSGKAVLITGGGTNLGLSTAHAFVLASASAVVITGRRGDVLDAAKRQLEAFAQANSKSTKIVTSICDVADREQVDALWRELAEEHQLNVDVLVSNAARPPQPKGLLEATSEDVWAQMETNVKGPLLMAEKLMAQTSATPKYIINVSVSSIHNYTHPAAAARPGGTLSKTAATTLFQLLAMETPVERLQVVSYHPGLLWNEYFASLGLPRERFDSLELAAAFAVWASTEDARFLHGRFVWASWDVDELRTVMNNINEDPYFLRVGVGSLKGGNRA